MTAGMIEAPAPVRHKILARTGHYPWARIALDGPAAGERNEEAWAKIPVRHRRRGSGWGPLWPDARTGPPI